jgi:hypothetical protein
MTQLELLSPGWIRAVKMIAGLSDICSGSELKLVTMIISQSFPANVLQSAVLLILFLF